ncbi:sulfatase-like hydrolase/transferase [Rubripirellula sp.]|nr:sulfatase-like hydrolase/transferase [Rubripirellula sp.]
MQETRWKEPVMGYFDYCRKVRFFLLALLFFLVVGFRATDVQAKVPNIVIFLSDDHTWRDSSVYGSPDIETPQMQRIANLGMTFDQAFVASPSCAPSRAALLTGLYPSRNGAEVNHSRPSAEITKLPAYLQRLGYEVVSFGKVGHYGQTPDYGFDLAKHFGYHDDVAVDEAIDWLGNRDSEKPLCLFVGTNWPHVPWPDKIDDIDPAKLSVPPNHVDTPTSRDWRAKYIAAIRRMDQELGRVYDAAFAKFGEEFFFLHTSDHGAQWPFGKWNLYDDGIRTPMIVTWPGRIESGTRSNAMVSWVDVLPTLLEVAGVTEVESLDGKSFLSVLLGKKERHRDFIFTTHSGDGDFNVFPIRSVRTADGWKYIRNLHPEYLFGSHVTHAEAKKSYWQSWVEEGSVSADAKQLVKRYQHRLPEELFHTPTDPYESLNRIDEAEQATRINELREQLDIWMGETRDPQTVYGRPRWLGEKGRPNVITVFIDDMGWSDLSCFGGERTVTENIDRLASEGHRFTNFYVNSPICSPSRVALSTGQYPHRHRITSYLSNRAANRDRGMDQWLSKDAPMLSRELRRSGYATGHFGKWHMGGQRDVGNAPLIKEYGFDHSLTNFEGLGPRVLPLKDAYDGKEPAKHDLGSANLGKGPIEWEDRSLITARFVEEAVGMIDRSEVLDQPFFINLWPDDVHSPFFPPEVLRDETDGSKRSLYYAVLDAMDQQLGVLFDRVRNDPDLRDNTLILVMSDNGHEEGAGSSDPLRGAKTWLYEGGVRSPLIVWGPGLVNEKVVGTTNRDSVFCSLDINRSLYQLADVSLPSNTTLDGENLLDTLLGNSFESRVAPIFWRRPPDRPGKPGQDNPDLAVRDGHWKFLVNYDGSDPQLYDLQQDPSESKNVTAANPQIVQRLHQLVLDWNQDLPRDAGDPQWQAESRTGSLNANEFVNPIGEGADPWVIRDPNQPRYLWCMSEGNRGIAIHVSDSVSSMGQKTIVWEAPDRGPYSKEIWAPELHFVDGKWRIYFAGSDGQNKNHLAYVLSAKTDDPLGEYELSGPFATGDGEDGKSPNLWAIDMTVFDHQDQLYAVWSGWDEPESDRQYLYIAPMESPTKLSGKRVRLCANDDYLWERVEPMDDKRGLHEAPQVFKAKGRVSIVYSCGASWLPTYKLGLLELAGEDPLKPESWKKREQPIFAGSDSTYGVGHSCFVKSLDGKQWWHVFHAKRDRDPGWRRAVFAQPMKVGRRGFPLLDSPIDSGTVMIKPSGSPQNELPVHFDSFRYFGHHQMFDFDADSIRLGILLEDPVNTYRSGEKVIFEGRVENDFRAAITIDFQGDQQAGDGGLLFRVTGPAVGYDAQRGYFAGIVPRTNLLILGKMDGERWQEMRRELVKVDVTSKQRLAVDVKGDRIEVFLEGESKIIHHDATYDRGSIGLRVVNSDTVFSNLQIE